MEPLSPKGVESRTRDATDGALRHRLGESQILKSTQTIVRSLQNIISAMMSSEKIKEPYV